MKRFTLITIIFLSVNQLLAYNIQNIPTVSIRSYNGQLLGWSPSGTIQATESELGEREFFKIHNISRPDSIPQNNDILVLQASNGHFVFVRADGRIGLHPDFYNQGVRFQVSVLRRNNKGDLECSFKSQLTGKFVMAANGGGSEVNNNALLPREFETFTLRFHEPLEVFIRNSNNDFICVSNTGQLITQISSTPPIRSSFSIFILNRSNLNSETLESGDTIAIRFRNSFVGLFSDRSAFGTGSIRVNRSAQFVIQSTSSPPVNRITTARPFSVRSVESGLFWTVSNFIVRTSSNHSGASSNFTFVTPSQGSWAEPEYPNLPSSITSYPFRIMLPPKEGIDSIVIFKLRLETDFTVSDEEISNRIFGPPPSLSSWLRDNSNGRYNVANKGIFGPFQVFAGWSSRNYDTLLTLAENSGINLNQFGNGVWDQNKYKLFLIEPGALWGNAGYVIGTSRRGYRFNGVVGAAGITPDFNVSSRMVLAHEFSHVLFEVTDRYPWRRPLTGDLIAVSMTPPAEKFTITKKNGSGPIQNGDQITLKIQDRWVVTSFNEPHNLNLIEVFTEFSTFTIFTSDGAGLRHGSNFFLKAHNNKYVMALEGGNSAVRAVSEIPMHWETFKALKINDINQPIASGDQIHIVSYNSFFLNGVVNGRSLGNPTDRKRGYTWERTAGGGAGGGFDNSSSNYNIVLLNLYDRIRLGWVRPKYLTPDMKGTYLIRPYIGSGDGIILFDPQNPKEWYTVENRRNILRRDEVPSSGLVISWVCEDESYWKSLYLHNNDDEFYGWKVNYPVVISAVKPRNPPNPFFYPPLLNPNAYTARNTTYSAFCSFHPSHELVLPLGNGSPSRFHIKISKVRNSDALLLTIK